MTFFVTIGAFLFSLLGRKESPPNESERLGFFSLLLGVLLIGLVVALFITRSTLAGRTSDLAAERVFKASVVAATRTAAGSPTLDERNVPAQITALGNSVRSLDASLALCNSTALAAANNDAARQRDFEARFRALQTQTLQGQALIDRLRASAAATRPGAAVCVPSDTVREIWP
jgi:hypothetical protein